MKLIITRSCVQILVESLQDQAFVEDTLGLKSEGDSVELRRINAVGTTECVLLEARSRESQAMLDSVESTRYTIRSSGPFNGQGSDVLKCEIQFLQEQRNRIRILMVNAKGAHRLVTTLKDYEHKLGESVKAIEKELGDSGISQ